MATQSVTHEILVPIKIAAAHFGLPYWKLLRAVKSGLIPSYMPFNSRRLVYLSEISAYICSTRSRGMVAIEQIAHGGRS
jgi:hypothetical protein